MQQAHHIEIKKTARYYFSGPLSVKYRHICFVLHGYGQLVPYFIRHFENLNMSDTLFIAPEGLHRFYLQGSRGRVGASWMTKEDRLSDIEDYCAYLDLLYEHFSTQIGAAETVGLLGFSQGVATACRWLTNSDQHFDYLINYAGAFPPDLNQEKAIDRMRNLPVYMLVGSEDEYISEEQYEDHLKTLKDAGYEVNAERFEGSHRLYTEVLQGLFAKVLNP